MKETIYNVWVSSKEVKPPFYINILPEKKTIKHQFLFKLKPCDSIDTNHTDNNNNNSNNNIILLGF